MLLLASEEEILKRQFMAFTSVHWPSRRRVLFLHLFSICTLSLMNLFIWGVGMLSFVMDLYSY